MADLAYCTSADVIAVAGQLAIDLRTDDVPDLDAHLAVAIEHASGRVDFYLHRYAQSVLAGNRWVKGVAELAAVRWLCVHRLNDLPKSVDAEWEERKEELELVRAGKAEVPRAAKTRRPVTVTNSTVDNNRRNNQIRVDTNRSTGVAKGYKRPVDPSSPDER
jgi:DNA-binding NtrC family response regulator